MSRLKGPTVIIIIIIIEDDEGNYAQAAGTDDRYAIESRTVFGEGRELPPSGRPQAATTGLWPVLTHRSLERPATPE
jgi:hypothetical protein